jgi:hypothetical protein
VALAPWTTDVPRRGTGLSHLLLLCGSGLLAVSLWLRDELPPPDRLDPRLSGEPVQQPVTLTPFEATAGGVTYTIRPLATYEIWGLVVSRHDTSSWWNWIHAAWNDHLNVMDLCVVFAENVSEGAYRGLHYSSGQFQCFVETSSEALWKAFSMRALANNHLLADDPALARRLRDVRRGDQVRISGLLAEYSHRVGGGFRRGSSLSRDDTGNGACETVFVQDVEVLRRGGRPWRSLVYVALGLLLLGLMVWLRQPFRVSR